MKLGFRATAEISLNGWIVFNQVRHNRLREVLVEMEAEVVKILICMLPKLLLFYKYTDT